MKTYTFIDFCLFLKKNGPMDTILTKPLTLGGYIPEFSPLADEEPYKKPICIGILLPCEVSIHYAFNKKFLNRDGKVTHENVGDTCEIYVSQRDSKILYLVDSVDENFFIVADTITVMLERIPSISERRKCNAKCKKLQEEQ